jgi:undecaprenyl-diphosphatase
MTHLQTFRAWVAKKRWLWPLALLGGVALLGAGVHLAGELLEGESFNWDRSLLLALRQPGDLARPIGPRFLTQSAIDISALGGFTVLWLFGAFTIGFLIYVKRRAEAGWLAASVIGASGLNTLLKLWLNRPRPEIVPHLVHVANASFPSGHAMISAAVYLTIGVMLAETQPKLAARTYLVGFAGVLVLLIGTSRVYLGVHWPSDVLAGWCFGSVWALAVFAANRALRRASGSPADAG